MDYKKVYDILVQNEEVTMGIIQFKEEPKFMASMRIDLVLLKEFLDKYATSNIRSAVISIHKRKHKGSNYKMFTIRYDKEERKYYALAGMDEEMYGD